MPSWRWTPKCIQPSPTTLAEKELEIIAQKPRKLPEKLDLIFQRFYPLFVRRAEIWNFKQKPGQKYSEVLAMCRRIGDECDVMSMTGEEVICTKMITLCTDEELKAELMKTELPIPGLMQIVHQYERFQAGKLAFQQAQQANVAGP